MTNGSAVVTGSGTSWLANAFAGGVFQLHVLASGTDGVTNGTATFTSAAGNFQAGHVGMTIRIGTKGAYIISAVASAISITLKNPDGSAPSPSVATALTYNVGPESPYDILSVDSNTQITLTQPWAGPTLTGIAYETWRPIKIIGDVSGYKTDGVGGIVRITGSDNDTSTTRSNCIAASAKNYFTIQGFALDLSSAPLMNLSSGCTNTIVQDCFFQHAAQTKQAFVCQGTGFTKNTIRRCRMIFSANAGNIVHFSHSSAIDNAACIAENCIVSGAYGAYALNTTRVGGILFRNNIVICAQRGISVDTALSTGQAISAHNNIIQGCSTGLAGTSTGDIIADYNNLFQNGTARASVNSGANDNSSASLFLHTLLLSGYRMPSTEVVSLSNYSTLAAKAGFNPPADDFFGLPRPATNAKNSWGAIQFNPVVRDTTTVDAGTASLKLTDAGRHQVIVNVTNASTTISIKVYREANYAGSNPGFVIRQAGQADIVVTDAGSSGAFNTITTTFTPAATTKTIIVELFSLNAATGGNFAVYFDTMLVATALTTGGFEQWITDRIPLSNYAGTPGGGSSVIASGTPFRGPFG